MIVTAHKQVCANLKLSLKRCVRKGLLEDDGDQVVVPSYLSGRMFCDPADMTTCFPCWTNPLRFGYHGIMTPPGCHDSTVRQNSCAGLGRCSESECLSQGSNNTKSLSRGTDTSATSSCESTPDKQPCPISSLID